jgi:hypothetical protein
VGIFRTAVNPSLGAAGKTSCFSRSGKYPPHPALVPDNSFRS